MNLTQLAFIYIILTGKFAMEEEMRIYLALAAVAILCGCSSERAEFREQAPNHFQVFFTEGDVLVVYTFDDSSENIREEISFASEELKNRRFQGTDGIYAIGYPDSFDVLVDKWEQLNPPEAAVPVTQFYRNALVKARKLVRERWPHLPALPPVPRYGGAF